MKIAPLSVGRSVVAASILVLVVATWLPQLDRQAVADVNAGFDRAGITFATARAMNAGISLLQGTELSVGMGVNATFSIGEILDPFNDLVEQFGDLMLLAMVSFGIQKVLLAIGQAEVLKIGVTALLLAWGGLSASAIRPPRWLLTLLMLGLMIRFALPVATVGTNAIFRAYLEKDYQTSQQGIEVGRQGIDDSTALVTQLEPSPAGSATPAHSAEPKPPSPDTPPAATGWLERTRALIREMAASVAANMDPRPALERLKRIVEAGVHHMIQLIVVFLLETMVVPLAILFALYVIAKSALNSIGSSLRGRHPDRRSNPGEKATVPPI